MAATTVTIALLTKIITPVITELYTQAKGQAKSGLAKWSTNTGIRKIATSLAKIDKVKTIWSPEDEKPLSKFYYPSRILNHSEIRTIEKFSDLPDGNLVIEGIVGQGKSIFMRHLASSLINEPAPTIIPIFLELRNLSERRDLSSLIAFFLNSINVNYTPETFDYLATSGKIALILDGFDEIPSNCVTETILALEILQTTHPDLKIIISSRPQSHIQNASGFRVIKLVPLTLPDYAPFISKLIVSITKRHEVEQALNNCAKGIVGIINTPLMLTLVILIYQTEKEIPTTLSEFFDKLFGVVFAKHDRLKAGFNRQHHSGLSENQLKKLFEIFCFMTVQNKLGRSLSESQFNKIFERSIAFAPEYKCQNDDFKKDIIKVACLIIEEGIDMKTFLHKSILDYHAAAFVSELTESQAEKFYTVANTQYKNWEHVLQFLEDIDKLRYTKFYLIKYFPDYLTDVRKLISSGSEKDVYRFFRKVHPNSSVKFDKHGNALEVSRTVANLNQFYSPITEALTSSVFALGKKVTPELLSRIAEKHSLDCSESTLTVSVIALMDELGYEPILQAIKISELTADQDLKSAVKYLESESKKDDLFVDILAAMSSVKSGPN
ncbi:NACHT domain-containing protein [Pseudomonas alliivorans]|nr:NACHT domain-containing protein [Pseudomonas alliivorans]MEE4874099.1 NACHT domain-containing protein [Pseudomonas alliivorans]